MGATSQLLRAVARRTMSEDARRRVRSGIRVLLGRDFPGRTLEVFSDDTYIVSYPKSGNTWVRFLVANLLHPDPTDFTTMETRVPTIYQQTAQQLAAFARPRVLKSHEYFDPRYPRVVYVVRDPRDVAVSYFHYSKRKGFLGEVDTIATFTDSFLTGSVNRFGTWYENVASWLAARDGSPDMLFVRYEDLRKDTAAELRRIAEFLRLDGSDTTIARAVDASSFERMRELEEVSGGNTLHLKHKRADVPFIRKGVAGGWKQELPDTARARIESAWGTLMERLQYR
jgi:hypothetical protein